VITRGGPQLPWQRLEAAAALIKQVCDRDNQIVDGEDYDPADSVAMDGSLIMVFVALTIG